MVLGHEELTCHQLTATSRLCKDRQATRDSRWEDDILIHNDAVEKGPPMGICLVVNENNAIVGHAPGSPNGGTDLGVPIRPQGNRHRVHRPATFAARRQRHLLGLAAAAGHGSCFHARPAG